MPLIGITSCKKLEDYKPEYLSGFQAERYAVGLKEGFEQARGIMDTEIRLLCCQQIGGNHQRLDSVQTQYAGITRNARAVMKRPKRWAERSAKLAVTNGWYSRNAESTKNMVGPSSRWPIQEKPSRICSPVV